MIKTLRASIPLIIVLAHLSCAHAARQEVPTTQPLASPADLPGLPNFARVSPALYRGAQPTREGFERLKQMGVKTVVDLRGKSHRDDLDGLGLKPVHIPSSAARVEESKLLEFLRIVRDPANQPVFVHCNRGADRTGCAVALYRMTEQGWSRHDAEAELPRFHFSPVWQDIAQYLDAVNVDRLRRELERAVPTTAATRAMVN